MNARRLRLWLAVAVVTALTASVASAARVAGGNDMQLSPTSAGLEALDAVGGALMVELAGDPSAEAFSDARRLGASEASAGAAGVAQKARNDRAQQAVLAAIAARGIDADPLYRLQTTYNGIAVQAEPGAASALAALPGVAAVHVIPLATIENHSSVPLIGGQQAWEAYGKTGAGMSIAVIDTGIDWVHRGFGGSGSSADYTIAKSAGANPPANPNVDNSSFKVMNGPTQIYPTAKVVGGIDLVGDSYNADPTSPGFQPVPNPDPNPMDCNGHGSHVAGTAAGNGVNADGTTYTGPYDGSLNTGAMGIGPGVAPQAGIYGVRVFGCAGSTAVTAQAIEWATDPNRDGNPADHVDVINMSLGSAYGTPDDPSAAASNTAVAAGVIVVTSAGNNSDVYYVTSSPGSAVRALATASSIDASDRAEAIIVNSPAAIAGTYIGSKSVNFNWTATPTRTGNLYYPATNQFGCSLWTGADAANIAGKIVLVDWKIGNNAFPCGSTVRANNATAAGAIGIIMADSTTFLDTAISGNAAIPAMYTTVQVGNTLKSQLTPGVVPSPAINVTLSSLVVGEQLDPGRVDQLSGFSSRGPRARDTGPKPDIAAPGQTIWSVGNGTGFRGATNNGTSMASPHMAGVMALLKQAHSGWSVEQLKALAMNTAHHDLYTGPNLTGNKYGIGRIGAGRVDAGLALASESIAYNADGSGSVGVSFGAVEVYGTLTLTKNVRIVNNSSSTQTYGVGIEGSTSIPGVSFFLPDESLTLAPGATGTFRVQLLADAAVMQNTRDATVAGVQAGNPRHWLSEASAYLLVTPQGRTPLKLRVPVYAAARPASATVSSSPNINLGLSGNTGVITMVGQGVNTGPEPLGYQSKVSAFELGLTSGTAALAPGVSPLARGADVRYAGAARKGANVYFGIATHADWSTPATDVQFTVQIDRNGDNTPDTSVFGTRFTDSDVFVAAVGSSAVGFTNIFSSNVTTVPFNNSVLVLPMPVTLLGLPAGQSSFRYRVVGSSRFWGTIDTTPWAKFDIDKPGVAFADGLSATTMYPDAAGQQIGVTYNEANYLANGSQGVLLLHHQNLRDLRTQVLGFVRTRGPGGR